MEEPQAQPEDGIDETKAKNLQSTSDDGLGDDFLRSWKPSKINSAAKFDIDDGLRPVPYKKLKIPDDFDIDMPNFDGGLTSKLSSFDVDLDFFESPKTEGSRDENGGSQNTESRIFKDQKIITLSESEESSSPSEQEKDCVHKGVDFENTSSLRSQYQHVNRSAIVNFDDVSPWKSQEESRKNANTVLPFLKSPRTETSRDENGGSQNTQSRIFKDQKIITLSESEESSSPSEQEKDRVPKSVDFENTSSLRSQDQQVNRSTIVDFDDVSPWKSQEESMKNGHNSETILVKRRETLVTERADEHVTLVTFPVERMVEVETAPTKVPTPQNLSNQVTTSLHEKYISSPPEKGHHLVLVDEKRNGAEISNLQPSKEKYTREVHSSKDTACILMSVDVNNKKELPIPMKDLGLSVQPVHSPRGLRSSRKTRITAIKRSFSENPLQSHGSSTAKALSSDNDPPSILTKKETAHHWLLRNETSMSPTIPITQGEAHDPSTSLESPNPMQVDSTLNTSKPHPLSPSSEEQRTGAFPRKAVPHKLQKPHATTKIDKVDSFQEIKISATSTKGNRAHGYIWNITN